MSDGNGRHQQGNGNRAGKYLTFRLGKEEYGIGILKVREVNAILPITVVPNTPKYVKGVINLRGKVVPVIDLRTKFGMEPIEYNDRTCIIVVDAELNSQKSLIGVIVDEVSEVLNIKSDEIEDTPDFGAKVDTSYIIGVAIKGEGVKLLLDIDEVLSREEIEIPKLLSKEKVELQNSQMCSGESTGLPLEEPV